MADLQTDVRYIKGIGETRAKALSKLGITTLRDLISYFPRTYEDRTLIRSVRELAVGEYACVKAMIAAEPTAQRISGGRTLVKAQAVDASGRLDLLFFNQNYRRSQLHAGETYVFYGKVEGSSPGASCPSTPSPPGSVRSSSAAPYGRGWTSAGNYCPTYCPIPCGRLMSYVM